MKFFKDKRILIIYLFVFLIIIIGVTYASQTSSLALSTTTALIGIDESAYGSTTFDSSNLDFKPILDSEVETNNDNVIKIDFVVGGAETNNAENIIYDIALNDLNVNCVLLSPYIKWKLIKNGTEISNGSLDYKFDTIVNGRLVLTTIQQDLVAYSTNKSNYDSYTFYMWFSDSCQNSDVSACTNKEDQSVLVGQNLNGKIEVELYTESKKELVRNPSTSLDSSSCSQCALSVSVATYDSVTTRFTYTAESSSIQSYNIYMEKNSTKSCTYSFGNNTVTSISDSCIFDAFDLSTIKLDVTKSDNSVITCTFDDIALENGYNIIYDALNNEYETEKNSDNILDKIYPVGSIYISTSSENPSNFFGGTWEAYAQGRTLIGVGSNGNDNYESADITGGTESVALSTVNLPSHTHTITPNGSVSSTFTGTQVSTSTDGTSHNHQATNYTGSSSGSLDKSAGFTNRVIINNTTPKMTTSSAGDHTHTFTASGTVSSTFTGKSTTTSSVGNGTSFSIMNPHIVTYIWKRTA